MNNYIKHYHLRLLLDVRGKKKEKRKKKKEKRKEEEEEEKKINQELHKEHLNIL